MLIIVKLKDIIVDPKREVDLTALPPDEAVSLIRKSYGFLAPAVRVEIQGDTALISFDDDKQRHLDEAGKLYNRGLKKAEGGEYENAAKLFERVLELVPDHKDARRNFAMAHLEMGNKEEAKNHLIESIRVDPSDVWAWVLLGNIYAKHEDDLQTGARFYQKAYEINPDDPYLLTNYAAVKLEMRKPEEARRLFERALEINRGYPNAFFGLAMLHHQEGRTEDAYRVLTELFTRPVSRDPRSGPVYDNARATYLRLNGEIAVRRQAEMQAFIGERRKRVGEETGFPIEVLEDNKLEGVYAVSQTAWKHGRDCTVIRYRQTAPGLMPHIIAHELEHVCLEFEARAKGRNRFFSTTGSTRKHAIESIADHVAKLQKLGFSEDAIQAVTLQMTAGLANQLFNCPLDMVIERRVFEKYEIIRPCQFVSLAATHAEYSQVLKNEEIRRLSPPRIFRANNAMNCAYALFIDSLYGSATGYADSYRATDFFAVGQQLFAAWQSIQEHFQPGDEYRLVDEFARILKLEKWFEWKPDDDTPLSAAATTDEKPEGTTNPELLKQKHPASVEYLLSALERYDKMPVEKVREIAFETALLGRSGLDYASSDKKYRLKSLPDEEFSGLQLMCLMYAGFKRVAPEHDLGLDLNDPFLTALSLFTEQKSK